MKKSSWRTNDQNTVAALEKLELLSSALGISINEAIGELISILSERRDFFAIPHPDWRARHLDECLQHMERVYQSRDIARKKFDAMREFKKREGNRVEDKEKRIEWRDKKLRDCADKNFCPYCKTQLAETIVHVDHMIPLARGGLDDPSNWQLICHNCNLGKSDMLVEQVLSPWRSTRLFRELILQGKTSLSLIERFDILARANFICQSLQTTDPCTGALAIYYKAAPDKGGQAIPENLLVLCQKHGFKSMIVSIRSNSMNAR